MAELFFTDKTNRKEKGNPKNTDSLSMIRGKIMNYLIYFNYTRNIKIVKQRSKRFDLF